MALVLDPVAAPPDETVAYGPGPDQVYDIRRPSDPARGVTVVIVHGGFWRPGIDRAHAAPQAAALADAGLHVVVVEYRRAALGGWSDMQSDLLAAREAILARTDLPTTLVLIGHSAGGHLVTWLAAQPDTSASGTEIAGVISLAGCVDLHRVHELDLGGGAAQALMGSTPQHDPQAWSLADPARLSAPKAPVVTIHGDRDEQVPQEISQSYRNALPGTRSIMLSGVDHFDLIDPQTPAFRIIQDTIFELAGEPTT